MSVSCQGLGLSVILNVKSSLIAIAALAEVTRLSIGSDRAERARRWNRSR